MNVSNAIAIKAEETVFPLAEVFTIARGSRTEARVVTVTITDDEFTGIGECVPYARYGETVDGVIEQIHNCRATDRLALQDVMKPGAARNALDCAFWDLEAKRGGQAGVGTGGHHQTRPRHHRLHPVARRT